jgi:hypothetical protein
MSKIQFNFEVRKWKYNSSRVLRKYSSSIGEIEPFHGEPPYIARHGRDSISIGLPCQVPDTNDTNKRSMYPVTGGLFRLRNVTIVGYLYYLILLNCYMFRSYDHLQAEIY